MKNQQGFTILELMIAICLIGVIILTLWAVISCVSWVTSGEVANDIGEFIGEVEQSIENKRNKY